MVPSVFPIEKDETFMPDRIYNWFNQDATIGNCNGNTFCTSSHHRQVHTYILFFFLNLILGHLLFFSHITQNVTRTLPIFENFNKDVSTR